MKRKEVVAVLDFSKKKVFCIFAVSIILGLLYMCIVPWVSIFIGTLLLEQPAKPEIVRGEFSFTLVYKIGGERKVVKDTLICEFDGIGIDEGSGKYRKWKSKLASGNTNIILWEKEEKRGLKKKIYYNYAPPGYYMGDPDDAGGNKSNASDIVLEKESNDSRELIFISEKRLLQKYDIEIISWDCEEPIENVFE